MTFSHSRSWWSNPLLPLALLALGACGPNQPTLDSDVSESAPTTVLPVPAARGTLDSGYVMMGGAPVMVRYTVIEGVGVMEGDIILGPVDRIPKSRPAAALLGTGRPDGRWTGGVIPYTVASGTSASYVTAAVNYWNATYGQIKWVPRSGQSSYVTFKDTTGVCGGVGGIGDLSGQQLLYFKQTDAGCRTPGVLAHEMMHKAGVWHEQGRCDRDTYVTVLWDSLATLADSAQFDKHCPTTSPTTQRGVDYEDYDAASLMHYDSVFTPTGKVALLSKVGQTHLFGNRDSLSMLDVFTIANMYAPTQQVTSPVTNTNDGGLSKLSWGAAEGRFASYYVELVVEYVYNDDYEDEQYITTAEVEPADPSTTSSLSITNANRAYTGSSQCTIAEGLGYSEQLHFYYDVYVRFGNSSLGPRFRTEARVAPPYPQTCEY